MPRTTEDWVRPSTVILRVAIAHDSVSRKGAKAQRKKLVATQSLRLRAFA